MPLRHYDLDEVLAYYQSDPNISATDVVEHFGLDVTPRAIQKAVNRYLGARPRRPPVGRDRLRAAVVIWMEGSGLDPHYCLNGHYSAFDCSIRFLKPEDLSSAVFVCRQCKRSGDI